nr:calcium/calmodulin-dependent protein kinase type 1 [Quercus suber]
MSRRTNDSEEMPSSQGTEPDDEAVDFASLVPLNNFASRAFESLRDSLAQQPQRCQHHKHFVRLDARREVQGTAQSERGPQDSFDSDYTTERSDDSGDCLPGGTGCYALALIPDHQPCDPIAGWRIGVGRWDKDPLNGQVDLLVVDPRQSTGNNEAKATLYPRHARFTFRADGRLFLHADHSGVTLDGKAIPQGQARLLPAQATVSIGPLRFLFCFTVQPASEEYFQAIKQTFLRKYLHVERDLISVVMGTPTPADPVIEEWRIHGVVGSTRSTTVHAASNIRTGELVAVKRIFCDPSRGPEMRREPEIYTDLAKPLRSHRYGKFVMQQIGTIPEHQRRDRQYEMYLLWHPLVCADFARFMKSDPWSVHTPPAVKLDLFCQTLLGLKALHEIGWIHRDLKPSNLGIVSRNEDGPRAVIIDLGQAIVFQANQHHPRPRHCGTIGFLAPELENDEFAATYNQKVDIWSMGAVAVFLFMNDISERWTVVPWPTTHNMFLHDSKGEPHPMLTVFRDFRAKLSQAPRDSLDNLVYHMLAHFPRDRLDINGVLAHPALQPTMTAIEARMRDMAPTGSKRPSSQQ